MSDVEDIKGFIAQVKKSRQKLSIDLAERLLKELKLDELKEKHKKQLEQLEAKKETELAEKLFKKIRQPEKLGEEYGKEFSKLLEEYGKQETKLKEDHTEQLEQLTQFQNLEKLKDASEKESKIFNDSNELVEIIETLNASMPEIHDGRSTFFYRGTVASNLPDVEDVPSIFRKGLIKYENRIIEDTLSAKHNYFKDCNSAIEKLEKLQHYGIPTRLLDITRNPLVALFFACQSPKIEDECGNISIKKEDGKVIIYGMDSCYVKYNNSDTVSVLANLAFMPKDFKIDLNKFNNETEPSVEYDKLVHQICSEKSYFKHQVQEEHLTDYIVCVIPHWNNERIIAQQGAFLLYGMQNGDKSLPSRIGQKGVKYMYTMEITIPFNYKANILNDLASIGISQEILFPELDKYVNAIKRKYPEKLNL